MNDCSSHDCAVAAPDPRYRRVLWIALIINASMFGVELFAGLAAASTSLQADAMDFLGDSANYAISLFVLGLSIAWRARAALVKGITMAVFAAWVLGTAAFNMVGGAIPEPFTMGWVGALALVSNVTVAILLYAFRTGDSNMRSVWLCSRNDALGNIAVMVAALGVFGTKAAWPDLVVAGIMAVLALSASRVVITQARQELARIPLEGQITVRQTPGNS